ncbi:MAG: dolichyl-phosphate beta-glucosyltransferase [bacterium]
MKNNCDISIVIPAYNEEKRLPKTLKIICDYFEDHKDNAYEIIVVDDGSSDDTEGAAKSLGRKEIKVISYKTNRGKGYAVNLGVLKAEGDFILFADADNSTPFEQIEKFLSRKDEFDVIIASRYLAKSNIKVKQPFLRRLGAKMGNLMIRSMLLPKIKDTQCGFKMFRKSAAREIFSGQTIWRWGFDIEILYIAKKLGYKTKEVPVNWYNDEGTKIQSPLVFLSTLSELFKIKMNSLQGKYKK